MCHLIFVINVTIIPSLSTNNKNNIYIYGCVRVLPGLKPTVAWVEGIWYQGSNLEPQTF